MSPDTTVQAICDLKDLLRAGLSTGRSILEMHGRDEAYSEPALPDAVAFPVSCSTTKTTGMSQSCDPA